MSNYLVLGKKRFKILEDRLEECEEEKTEEEKKEEEKKIHKDAYPKVEKCVFWTKL